MPHDFSKLRGRIVEKYGSQENFSKVLGLSTRSLSSKMNGKVSWRDKEISKASELLSIPDSEIYLYFFNSKVL